MTDQLIGKRAAQHPGKGEYQHGAGADSGCREEESGPGSEEHGPGQGGDIAGDGREDHREQLDKKIGQMGVRGQAVNIVAHGGQ